jgi:hypothetical protein
MKFIGKLSCPARLKKGEACYDISDTGKYFVATRYGFEQEFFLSMDKVERWCNGEDVEGDEVNHPDLAELENQIKFGTAVADYPPCEDREPQIYDDDLPKVKIVEG